MTITRRSLFLGSAAVILTPGILMPVKKIVVPEPFIGWDLAGNYHAVVHPGWMFELERAERQLWGDGIVSDPRYKAEQKKATARFRAMLDNLDVSIGPPLRLGESG